MAEKRPSLNVLSGPLSGRKLVLEDAVDNILIGRDPSCGFVLDTPGVSPIHARLWVDLNGAKVYDTNSPTGVYVNDDRVVREAPVRNGDILWLGPPGEEGSVLIQCILPPPAAAAPPPVPMAPTLAETDDTSATVVGVPAYRPADDMGFPEFEVEPTVVMPPPPSAPAPPSSAQEPMRFNVPLPTSAPPPEFEDELAETVLDVPAPAMPPKPAPPAPKEAA